MSDLATDREFLTSRMYATDEALAVRFRTHELYTRPIMHFPTWVVDHIPWRGDERVLDLGCGSGAYVEPVGAWLTAGGRLTCVDLSLGMLRDLAIKSQADNVVLVNADAMHIPLPDASYAAILANHMLYHVPCIETALSEIRRTLRPGGNLIAATNARHAMEGFWLEMTKACEALGKTWQIKPSGARTRFTLENGGALIERFFSSVKRYTFEGALVFPEAAPAITYVDSLRDVYEPQLPEGLSWREVMAQVERQVESVVASEGDYRVFKAAGVFVATKDA